MVKRINMSDSRFDSNCCLWPMFLIKQERAFLSFKLFDAARLARNFDCYDLLVEN